MDKFTIRLIPSEKMMSILPFLKMLDNTIDENVLKSRIEDMLLSNYKCVGIYNDKDLIGISGLWILNKYYIGKHIELDNVMVHPDYQGKGVGNKLLEWISNYCISIGCNASELNCYVNNNEGIKFWLNKGYKLVGFHFQKIYKK